MDTEIDMIFVILDKFYTNSSGSFDVHVLGIFDEIDIAKQNVENLNLKNFRWMGDDEFKFSTDIAHVGMIRKVPKNTIWIGPI